MTTERRAIRCDGVVAQILGEGKVVVRFSNGLQIVADGAGPNFDQPAVGDATSVDLPALPGQTPRLFSLKAAAR